MEGQRGCLFVKLHEGKNLSKWSATQGYQTASRNESPYDTFVRVRLASENSETNTTERVALTKIVTNQTNPRCDHCCCAVLGRGTAALILGPVDIGA